MTQTWETKLTPEQEAAKVSRVILFTNGFMLDYQTQRAFEDAFKTVGTTLPILLQDDPYRWCTGTRLFLDDVALELSFDGGNMQFTFFERVLYPVWDTVVSSIILMNGLACIDNNSKMHIQRVQGIIQTFHYYGGFGIPFVVVALKQEGEDIFSVEDLRVILNSPRHTELTDIPIVLCDPKDRESVKNVLITALEHGLHYLDSQIDEES